MAQHAGDVYPRIGNLDVAAIARPHILDVLDQPVKAQGRYPAGKLWEDRRVTADRVRNRVELILSWAAARGYRSSDANPARWSDLKHALAKKATKVEHLAAVPFREVPTLFVELRKHQGVAAQALQFFILTVPRPGGELLGARWDEINFEQKIWTIPKERMKKGDREHRVPLSDAAIELLRALPTEDGNPFVFIGRYRAALSSDALIGLLKRLGRSETAHGFRSSFSDWANETTSHSYHTIEISLAHAVGNEVEKAYRRGDMFNKRRELMEAWAKFCTTPQAPSATVTPLRKKAAAS